MKFSMQRAIILSIIKEKQPISITKLAEAVGISSGNTIYRYLRELEKAGLIVIEKQPKKRGQPSMVSATDKAVPLTEFEKNILKRFTRS